MAKNFITTPREVNIEQLGLRQKEFTVQPAALIPAAANAINKFSFLPNIPLSFVDDIPVGVSALGTLVLDNLTFLPGKYSPINPTTEGEVVPYRGLTIDTVVIQANQEKNIIKTAVQGREGLVKEYISSTDIMIQIQGQIVGNFTNAYPRREMQLLLEILRVPEQLEVRSKFINDILGFQFITIEDWRLITTPGLRNAQGFVINAIQDISPSIDEITGEALDQQ